uniref:Orc1-like AAA ATPase domain-containing protein n=1 Tax=Odontella aurita TaxID=265563 RepID=A0A7S4K8D1_9STRA
MTCPRMPREARERYVQLKSAPIQRRSVKKESSRYWEDSLRSIGIIDTPDGLRLMRPGYAFAGIAAVGDGSGDKGDGGDDGGFPAAAPAPEKDNFGATWRGATEAAATVLAAPSTVPTMGDIVASSISNPRLNVEDSRKVAAELLPEQQQLEQQQLELEQPSSSLQLASQNLEHDSATHFAAARAGSSSLSPAAERLLPMTTRPASVEAAAAGPGRPQRTKCPPRLDDSHPAPPLLSDQALLLNAEASGHQLSSFSMGSHPPQAPSSLEWTGESVLSRVELAQCVVKALTSIRKVEPSSSASLSPLRFVGAGETLGQVPRGWQGAPQRRGKQTGGAPNGSGNDASTKDDLIDLGVELYKIFVGHGPYEGQEGGEAGEDSGQWGKNQSHFGRGGRQEQGRSKRRAECSSATTSMQGKGSITYVPLSEHGLPPALSGLVSSLLEGRDYDSLGQVEEDLRLMTDESDRYLSVCRLGAGGDSSAAHPRIEFDSLLGREDELARLMESYDHGVGLVLVSGYSGTGKSSLVRAMGERVIERGAYFVSGKFDAMRQPLTLSAVLSALNDYCAILACDPDGAVAVRERIAVVMGDDSLVLASLLPNMTELVKTGDRVAAPAVFAGGDCMWRLMLLFRTFFRAAVTRTRPLVVALDDLQWSDPVSLNLMTTLVTDTELSGRLVIVGCYRDNEVGEGHPLRGCIDGIRRGGVARLTSVHLENFDRDGVNRLVSHALRLAPRTTRDLAEEATHKTGGNALFLVQFLGTLRDDGLLRYSLASRRWEWDITKVRESEIADDVVDLLTAKMLRLAPEVHSGLRIAAAFGAQSEAAVLQILDRAPENVLSTLAALDIATSEGLLVKSSSESSSGSGGTLRFSHDQIQRAAYLLIHAAERESFHLRLGRLLWKQSTPEEMDAHLFVVVDQLHRGIGMVSDPKEKTNIAHLSLLAGKKALGMSSFLPASVYMKAGIGLLSDDDWENANRELCLDLYSTCAETEYILGEEDNMQRHVGEVMKKACVLEEKLRAYYTLIQSLCTQNETTDAMNTALEVLGCLGEPFPPVGAVTKPIMIQSIGKTQKLLSTKTEKELLELDVMTDPIKTEAMRFLKLIFTYSFSKKIEYISLFSCRMVQLSLSHGVSSDSAFGFACYGMILCGQLADTAGGYRFGKLALSTMNRFDTKENLARVVAIVHGFIFNWTEPIQASLPCHKNAVAIGLSAGDTEYAMFNAIMYSGNALASGLPLGPLMDEMRGHRMQMIECKQYYMNTMQTPHRQFALNLLGRSQDPSKLAGEEMDEGVIALIEDRPTISAMALLYRLWLYYLFGKYRAAAETAERNVVVERDTKSTRFAINCNHYFFKGLAAMALARKEEGGGTMAEQLPVIELAIAKMRVWAASSSWNCQHKLELMEAERAYLEGDATLAAQLYERAVTTAADHRFVHEEALALERAGIFYLERGDRSTASGLFVKSQACYSRWGAIAKAEHIQELYF